MFKLLWETALFVSESISMWPKRVKNVSVFSKKWKRIGLEAPAQHIVNDKICHLSRTHIELVMIHRFDKQIFYRCQVNIHEFPWPFSVQPHRKNDEKPNRFYVATYYGLAKCNGWLGFYLFSFFFHFLVLLFFSILFFLLLIQNMFTTNVDCALLALMSQASEHKRWFACACALV